MKITNLKAREVEGKQKKNPEKSWHGVAIEFVLDGQVYGGLVFPKGSGTMEEVEVE